MAIRALFVAGLATAAIADLDVSKTTSLTKSVEAFGQKAQGSLTNVVNGKLLSGGKVTGASAVAADVTNKLNLPELSLPNLDVASIGAGKLDLAEGVKLPKAGDLKIGALNAGKVNIDSTLGLDSKMPNLSVGQAALGDLTVGSLVPSIKGGLPSDIKLNTISTPNINVGGVAPLELPTPQFDIAQAGQQTINVPALEAPIQFGTAGKVKIGNLRPKVNAGSFMPKVVIPDMGDISIPDAPEINIASAPELILPKFNGMTIPKMPNVNVGGLSNIDLSGASSVLPDTTVTLPDNVQLVPNVALAPKIIPGQQAKLNIDASGLQTAQNVQLIGDIQAPQFQDANIAVQKTIGGNIPQLTVPKVNMPAFDAPQIPSVGAGLSGLTSGLNLPAEINVPSASAIKAKLGKNLRA